MLDLLIDHFDLLEFLTGKEVKFRFIANFVEAYRQKATRVGNELDQLYPIALACNSNIPAREKVDDVYSLLQVPININKCVENVQTRSFSNLPKNVGDMLQLSDIFLIRVQNAYRINANWEWNRHPLEDVSFNYTKQVESLAAKEANQDMANVNGHYYFKILYSVI